MGKSAVPVADALLSSGRACDDEESDEREGNTSGPTYTWAQKQRMLKCYSRAFRAMTGAVLELVKHCMIVARDSTRSGAGGGNGTEAGRMALAFS